MKKFLHSFIEPQTVILWFTYWMHLLVIPCVIAFIINYFKSNQYKGRCVHGHLSGNENGGPTELFASHHHWLMRSFCILFVLSMISLGTSYAGFGIILAVVTVVYWFYRITKGMFYLAAHKPMPGYYCDI